MYNRLQSLEANQDRILSMNSKLIEVVLKSIKNQSYALEEIEREHPNKAQNILIESIKEVHNECTGIIDTTGEN